MNFFEKRIMLVVAHPDDEILGLGATMNKIIFEEFAKSLCDHLGDRLCDMDAICLEPYHEGAFPLQIKAGKWRDY